MNEGSLAKWRCKSTEKHSRNGCSKERAGTTQQQHIPEERATSKPTIEIKHHSGAARVTAPLGVDCQKGMKVEGKR